MLEAITVKIYRFHSALLLVTVVMATSHGIPWRLGLVFLLHSPSFAVESPFQLEQVQCGPDVHFLVTLAPVTEVLDLSRWKGKTLLENVWTTGDSFVLSLQTDSVLSLQL